MENDGKKSTNFKYSRVLEHFFQSFCNHVFSIL